MSKKNKPYGVNTNGDEPWEETIPEPQEETIPEPQEETIPEPQEETVPEPQEENQNGIHMRVASVTASVYSRPTGLSSVEERKNINSRVFVASFEGGWAKLVGGGYMLKSVLVSVE